MGYGPASSPRGRVSRSTSREPSEDDLLNLRRAFEASKTSSPLGDFAFLPSKMTERTSLLSVFRDASYSIEHLEPSPKVRTRPPPRSVTSKISESLYVSTDEHRSIRRLC